MVGEETPTGSLCRQWAVRVALQPSLLPASAFLDQTCSHSHHWSYLFYSSALICKVPGKILSWRVLASASLFTGKIWCLNISWTGSKSFIKETRWPQRGGWLGTALLGLVDAKDSREPELGWGGQVFCPEVAIAMPWCCTPGQRGSGQCQWAVHSAVQQQSMQ